MVRRPVQTPPGSNPRSAWPRFFLDTAGENPPPASRSHVPPPGPAAPSEPFARHPLLRLKGPPRFHWGHLDRLGTLPPHGSWFAALRPSAILKAPGQERCLSRTQGPGLRYLWGEASICPPQASRLWGARRDGDRGKRASRRSPVSESPLSRLARGPAVRAAPSSWLVRRGGSRS